MNIDLPAPGAKGIAVVKGTAGGVELVEVHVFDPSGTRMLTLDAALLGSPSYKDEAAARRDIVAALANNPVRVINLDEIP